MPDPFERVRKIALAFPSVQDSETFGSPSLKVNGKYLAQIWQDGQSLILSMEIIERDMWLAGRAEHLLHHRPLPRLARRPHPPGSD